ncbi:CMRF35-like molecule 6 [Alosa pseudoharengus]|uniref:CMRF35-like molecule 6 n=1 Tax=Alosa pseudoharengus TaxID=34774 RepID=UPI003F8C07F2
MDGMIAILFLCLFSAPSSGESLILTHAVGGSVDITCEIKDPASSDKFLCKGDSTSTCTKLYLNDNNKKYSLTYGEREKYFKVTIENLDRSDAGTYWCGLKFSRYTSIYHKVEIDISVPTSSSHQASPTAGPLTTAGRTKNGRIVFGGGVSV